MYKGKGRSKLYTEFCNQNIASCLMRNQIQIHGREAQLQPSRLLHVSLGNVKEKIKGDGKPLREKEKKRVRERKTERETHLPAETAYSQ